MKKPLLLGIILTVCVVIVAFVFAQFYPEGMISYWKFDEGSGITAFDSVDANDGTLVYGPGWTTGQVDGALSFDGANDYVRVPDHASLDFGPGQDFSLEAWIKAKPNQAGFQGTILAKLSDYTVPPRKRSFGYSMMIRGVEDVANEGKAGLWIGDGDSRDGIFSLYSVETYDDDIWHHIVATVNRDDMARLYVDGVEVNRADVSYISGVNISTWENLEIGREGVYDQYWFKGLIDEVAIYNRVLFPEEIQQHYLNGSYEVECTTPPDNMVSWWDGDSVSGTIATDIQNGNDGTMVGDVSIIPGKVGNAFSFDGVDDNVEVLDDLTLDITDSITLEAWIKADSTQTGRAAGIITKDDLSGGRSYNLHLSSASSPTPWALRMRLLTLNNNGIIDGTTDLRDNTWHHVAGTWNGSIMNLYVDGILQNSRSSAGSISITSTPVIIGDFGTSLNVQYGFNGLIDEVEIFNRALTASEIQDIYLAGSAGKCKVEPNQLPVAHAGPDQTLECTGPTGTPVTLDGSGSDPENDPLTYTWSGLFPEGGGTVTGATPTVTLPLGTSIITLVVNDGQGDSEPDDVDLTITVGVYGFLPPLAMLVSEEKTPLTPRHAFKQGRTLPLKLQLSCRSTALSGTDVAPPQIVDLVWNSDAIELDTIDMDAGQASDSGPLFHFRDPNWVYNLNTRDLSAGTYVITIEMPDGRLFIGAFVLR